MASGEAPAILPGYNINQNPEDIKQLGIRPSAHHLFLTTHGCMLLQSVKYSRRYRVNMLAKTEALSPWIDWTGVDLRVTRALLWARIYRHGLKLGLENINMYTGFGICTITWVSRLFSVPRAVRETT